MTIAKLEFHMKRAGVDLDEVTESEDKNLINAVIQLCKKEQHKEAASILVKVMEFECAWQNMDCDPSEHLVSTDDILIKCSDNNAHFRVGSDSGDLVITAAIQFTVEVKGLNNSDELFEWLDENAAWACCSFSPGRDWESGWGYTESDGDNLYIVEWEGNSID